MSPVVVSPMPQEFAIAHAARMAFFNCGHTAKKQRQELVAKFAEARGVGAGSLPLMEQLATIAGMSLTAYARQHSLLPVLRVAERGNSPDLHGGAENPRLVRLVGARLHTDRIHLCCQCVRNDLSHWSFSWFRRTHNLAGIEVCAVHGEPLHWVTAPDPLSCLPQHWVDSGDIESVKFDPTSEAERQFQLRLHATYEIFLERDRPFDLTTIRSALIERARVLGLRNSTVGSKPPLSDYVLERAPRAWLQRYWPELCEREKGVSFPALDRLNTSAITPGTGFAYAVVFATLFDTAEDAAHSLSRPTERPRKKAGQPAKSKYPQAFWQTEFVDIFAKMGGNVSATAKHLGVERKYLARKTRSLGLPSIKGGGTSPRWRALQRFVAGEGLADSCAAEGVDITLVEDMLRTASTSLVNVFKKATTQKRDHAQRHAVVASAHAIQRRPEVHSQKSAEET